MPKLDFVTSEPARLCAGQLYNVVPTIESPQGAGAGGVVEVGRELPVIQ